MLLLVVVTTGMRQRQYDIKKNKKGVIGIVYSLFLLTVALMLTAAITESKPASAISPIGVSAGTGAGGGVGLGGGAAFCKVSRAHSVHRIESPHLQPVQDPSAFC